MGGHPSLNQLAHLTISRRSDGTAGRSGRAARQFQLGRGERIFVLAGLLHCPGVCVVGSYPVALRHPPICANRSAARSREVDVYWRDMPHWIASAATVVTALVALAALIVSIWASRRVARKREFELLLERIDREAAKREERIDREAAKREAQFEREVAKREEAIREVMDRSDRKFEAMQKRSDELYRQLAEITARVTRAGAVLETAAEAAPATGQSEAVAAQDVPGGRSSD